MFNQAEDGIQGITADGIIESYKLPDGTYDISDAPFSLGRYLGHHVSQAFHDYTLLGRVLEEQDIASAEKEAGHYDYMYAHYDPLSGAERPKHEFAMSEEDWKKSDWYREKIDWGVHGPAMTPERARILAENYDERRYREAVIAAGDENFGLGARALGFGAMLLGGLPDPINVIPFSGGMVTAKTAAVTALNAGKNAVAAGALQGAKTGFVEGAIGGALSSALTLPDLASRGEDVGFADLLLTTAMGGILGAGIGGAGGALTGYRGIAASRKIQELNDQFLASDAARSSQDLREALALDIYDARLAANPDLDKGQLKSEAAVAAILFDRRAHSWASGAEGRTVQQYYDQWRPEFRGAADLEDSIRKEWGTVDDDWLSNFYAEEPSAPLETATPETPTEAPTGSPRRDRGGHNRQPADQGLRDVLDVEQDTGVTGTTTVVDREPTTAPAIGRDASVLTPSGEKTDVSYQVWEADDLIASHRPSENFRPNELYPQGVQERPYHSDITEQDKVRNNAGNLEPSIVINNGGEISNGPPVITPDGYVLGGNSRTMSIGLAYDSAGEKAGQYRQFLVDNAASYGIDPSTVAGMKKPVLVRVTKNRYTKDAMAELSRRYNEVSTKSLDAVAEGVSKGKLLRSDTVAELNHGLRDGSFETLTEYLNSPSSSEFVKKLVRDGVVEEKDIVNLIDDDGLLTGKGKELTRATLLGHLFPDFNVLKRISKDFPGIIGKLEISLPSLVAMKQNGGEWDIAPKILEALDLIRSAKATMQNDSALGAVNDFLQQPPLIEETKKFSNAAKYLAITLTSGKPKEIAARFLQMSQDAKASQATAGGSLLAGTSVSRVSPAQSFIDSFLSPLAMVDGAPVGKFSPEKNARHKALSILAEHNGDIFQAIEAVRSKIGAAADELNSGEAVKWKDVFNELRRLEGSNVNVLDTSKLIKRYGMKPGEKLWQGPATSEGAARGKVDWVSDTSAVVHFFQASDFSTAPHEIYHVFRREMADTALHGTDQEKADWKAICDFVGAEEGAVWTREQEERFALAGERYLAEGQAPAPELAGAFARLKQWFVDLYQKIRNVGVEISPQMRNVFDRMISSDLQMPRNEMADWLRAGLAPSSRRDLMRAMEKALSDFENGDAVDVRPILRESKAIREAYDKVHMNPQGGPPDEIMATISSPEFEKILIERGPSKLGENGEIIVRDKDFAREYGSSAWGLVKVIWRHGEESGQKFKVTKDDLVQMPRILREYNPIPRGEFGVVKGENRWVVSTPEGEKIVYALRRRKKGHQDPTLITVFRTNLETYGLSEKKNASVSSAGENPPRGGKSPDYRDTAGEGFNVTSPRDESVNQFISQGSPSVNTGSTPLTSNLGSSIDEQIARARQEAQADIPRSDFDRRAAQAEQEARLSFETEREVEYPQAPPIVEDAAGVAQNYQERMRQTLEAMNGGRPLGQTNRADLDAEAALHEEIAEGIERARQAGILTEEQQRELLLNREQTERAQQFDEMGQTAVECVWNAAEHI